MTELLLRLCSAALITKFIYGALQGAADTDHAIMSAVIAAWADILANRRLATRPEVTP